jgi:chromosome segregation protein
MPLRLKSLELHGYKTFATRTVFEFASGITAIVGPNGAGKSNIADSLRWVLGEQSYALLRGKKTEDMIFAGSEHRPRAGMASAEIIFDNTANWLPVDFAEVAMTRRAYRDGHNEYLLNWQHVRLRDMNELLAASGLSERTYTIVGQGLVDASLALKADERRRLFEEAAGVGLYRVRREEALKRLENTRRNLERVQDIMAELEPRLKTLERQARRAKEYSAAQADLRAVLREWYGYHWHRAQERLQETEAHVRSLQAQADEWRATHRNTQAQTSRFREHLAGLRARLNEWHHELSELYQQRESAGRDLAILDERRRSLATSRAELVSERQAAGAEEQLAQERLVEITRESDRLQAEFHETQGALELAQRALEARQSGRVAVEAELQAAREAIASFSMRKAETQARLDELTTRLESHKRKLESSKADLQSVEGELRRAGEVHAEAHAHWQELDERLRENVAKLEATKKLVAALEDRRRAELDEQAKLQSRHLRTKAQLEVIELGEQSLAGFAEGARFLLEAARQSGWNAHGVLSSALDVPLELESAISAALGDALDTVLLDDSQVEQALRLLESEDSGRAALLPLNGNRGLQLTPPIDADLLGIASQLVRVPAELQGAAEVLLGSTLIVRSRAAARRLMQTIPAHGRIVTLRGEVFRGDGLIMAGKAAASSTLSRPRQKRELSGALGEVSALLEVMKAKIEDSAAKLRSAYGDLLHWEAQAALAREQSEKAQSLEQKAGLDQEKQRRLLEWNTSRHSDLLQEMSDAHEEQKQLMALASQNEAGSDSARDDERRLANAFNQLNLEEVQEQAAYWSTRLAVSQQTVSGNDVRKVEREEHVARLGEQIQELQTKLAAADLSLKQLDEEKIAALERQETTHLQIEALHDKTEPAEKELEGAEQEENRLQELETGTQQSLTSAERSLAQGQIDLVRREEALDSLRLRIMDDFGLVSFHYAENVEGPVPLPFAGLVEELPVVTVIQPDLEDLLAQRRAHLRRLGLINPEAAKEYDSESERYAFMAAQVQDLHQAEADLRQVMSELDEKTRQQFRETYAAVDKQFRSIFTRLFGGGTARLSLTDPDDLVETGIEIEARLPGRREQGLSLLSGGERSLTAIALVFALLKVSPTPVCVMDEVDAMLDEANVGRFRDLLADLSRDTQFIIITHNRNTVQAADFIYGVTMGRDSTSQVISLKLDEVSEEMLGTGRP